MSQSFTFIEVIEFNSEVCMNVQCLFSYGLKWSSTTNGIASWLYSNWQQHYPRKKRNPKCPTAETRSPKTVSQMPSAFNLHLHSEWHCLCRRQRQCQRQRQRQPVKCYRLTIELKGATHTVCLEPMRAASMHKTKNLSSNTKGTDYYDRSAMPWSDYDFNSHLIRTVWEQYHATTPWGNELKNCQTCIWGSQIFEETCHSNAFEPLCITWATLRLH